MKCKGRLLPEPFWLCISYFPQNKSSASSLAAQLQALCYFSMFFLLALPPKWRLSVKLHILSNSGSYSAYCSQCLPSAMENPWVHSLYLELLWNTIQHTKKHMYEFSAVILFVPCISTDRVNWVQSRLLWISVKKIVACYEYNSIMPLSTDSIGICNHKWLTHNNN